MIRQKAAAGIAVMIISWLWVGGYAQAQEVGNISLGQEGYVHQ